MTFNKNLMTKIKVTQVRSGIGSTKRQKRTLEALGIKKLHNTIEVETSPQVLGMINKVKHLLRVEE
jgi:large subunit ribosomal protein L30